MTEKHDYAASVRRKGLENTGVTEAIAKKMYGTQGRTTLAIVELRHKRQINDDDTGRSVELVIEALEPSQDPVLDDHLRQLMRTLHQNRVLTADDQQLQIDTAADVQPTVEQLVNAGQHLVDPDDEDGADADPDDPAFEPHGFFGTPGFACTVCDQPAISAIHNEQPAEEETPVPA